MNDTMLRIHIGYTGAGMKDSGMRIRVEQELRDAFVAACHKLDVPAAQVLREHMKKIVTQVSQNPKPNRNTNKKQEATF